MSRKWAHWHGLELQITSAAQLKFIGVAKKTRTSRVVATVYHSHCRGAPEALLLRIKGVKLLPDFDQSRDGASFAGFQPRRTAFVAHEDSDHDVVLPIGHPKELAALGFHEPQLANGDLTNGHGYVQRTYRRGPDSRVWSTFSWTLGSASASTRMGLITSSIIVHRRTPRRRLDLDFRLLSGAIMNLPIISSPSSPGIGCRWAIRNLRTMRMLQYQLPLP